MYSYLIISFEKDIVLSELIPLTVKMEFTARATTFRRIPVREDSAVYKNECLNKRFYILDKNKQRKSFNLCMNLFQKLYHM